MDTVRHWKSELRTFRVLPPQKKLNFTESCVEQTSEKRKDCGMYCKVKAPYITCPSCNIFTWHKLCVERNFTDFSLNIPDFTSQTWKCPNCWTFKTYYHVIWIIVTLSHMWHLVNTCWIFSQHCLVVWSWNFHVP